MSEARRLSREELMLIRDTQGAVLNGADGGPAIWTQDIVFTALELWAALESIAKDPHCSYDHPTISPDGYGTGVVDGHRCAASKALIALGTPP